MAVIAFTGGGTGGHVYPGLAVIEAIKKKEPDTVIFWIGSGKETERRAVEQAGIPYYTIASGKMRRNLSLKNFTDVFNIIKGIIQAKKLLTQLKADLVFSKGGYVSVPPCIAASQLGIPVITHESDVSPGLATRINMHFADRLIASWDDTLKLLKPIYRGKTVALGNPVREAIAQGNPQRGREYLNFPPAVPLLLVLGGSQGAEQINKLIEAAAPVLTERLCIAHQTGYGKPTGIKQSSRYRQFPYLEKELPDVLAAADIIVCRAGAGTLWECTVAGKPMILIPLSGVGTRGDQVDNTRILLSHNAARALIGEAAEPDALIKAIFELLEHPDLMQVLPQQARTVLRIDASKTIGALCLDFIGKGQNNECT